MTSMQTEGIILQKLDFRERDKILTLFTPDLGVVKVLCKKARTASPLLKTEVVLTRGKSELYSAREFHIVDHFLFLRKNYALLNAAGSMLQTVLNGHFVNRPVPALYALLLSYMKNLPSMCDPKSLALSFQLKVQRHEGVLHLSTSCSACQEKPLFLYEGESFCKRHSPVGACAFTEEEFQLLHLLTYGRSFSQFKEIVVPDGVVEKVVV